MSGDDLTAHSHTLLDTNRYLTIGTADTNGRPWESAWAEQVRDARRRL